MANAVAKMRQQFFDAPKVKKALDRKTRKVLSNHGAKVRRTAQFSMRDRKTGHSPPGTPPFAHGKKQIKKLLFFAYDSGKKSVVTGPVLLESKKNLRVKIPRLHEEGGEIITHPKKGGTITKEYEPRPFMLPAAEEHRKTVTKEFEGTL